MTRKTIDGARSLLVGKPPVKFKLARSVGAAVDDMLD